MTDCSTAIIGYNFDLTQISSFYLLIQLFYFLCIFLIPVVFLWLRAYELLSFLPLLILFQKRLVVFQLFHTQKLDTFSIISWQCDQQIKYLER